MKKEIGYRRNYYTSDDSGKTYLFAILIPLGIVLLWTLICSGIASAAGIVFTEEFTINDLLWYRIPSLVLTQLSLIGVFFLYNKSAKVALSAANVKFKIGWKNTLICITLGVVCLFGFICLTSCFDQLLKTIGYSLTQDLGIPLDNFGWFILTAIIGGVLPAICEELIFRGIILTGLRKQMKDVFAILLSALMFAIMHGSLQQFIYPFIMGLVFGFIAVRTGSVISSMIIHGVSNILSVFMAYLQIKYNFSLAFVNEWWYYLLSFGLVAIVGGIIFLIDKFYFKHKNQKEFEKFEKSKLSIFLWVSIFVGLVILIFNIVWNFQHPVK